MNKWFPVGPIDILITVWARRRLPSEDKHLSAPRRIVPGNMISSRREDVPLFSRLYFSLSIFNAAKRRPAESVCTYIHTTTCRNVYANIFVYMVSKYARTRMIQSVQSPLWQISTLKCYMKILPITYNICKYKMNQIDLIFLSIWACKYVFMIYMYVCVCQS